MAFSGPASVLLSYGDYLNSFAMKAHAGLYRLYDKYVLLKLLKVCYST